MWPRVVRRAFSDPRVPHESTGVEGRGTEEVKTNDISGRVKVGEVGFTVEFGRPGVGVWFRDIQEMAWALGRAGVVFEKKNPMTSLMTDSSTGTLREDILNEKVLSAILEIKVPVERTEEIVRLFTRSKRDWTRSSRSAWPRAATPTAKSASSLRFWSGSDISWSARRRTSVSAGSRIRRMRRPKARRWRDDQHSASLRRRRQLSRRLRRFCDVLPRKERPGLGSQAAAVFGDGGAVPTGEPGRRAAWRRAARVEIDEPGVALEAGHAAGFSRR